MFKLFRSFLSGKSKSKMVREDDYENPLVNLADLIKISSTRMIGYMAGSIFIAILMMLFKMSFDYYLGVFIVVNILYGVYSLTRYFSRTS